MSDEETFEERFRRTTGKDIDEIMASAKQQEAENFLASEKQRREPLTDAEKRSQWAVWFEEYDRVPKNPSQVIGNSKGWYWIAAIWLTIAAVVLLMGGAWSEFGVFMYFVTLGLAVAGVVSDALDGHVLVDHEMHKALLDLARGGMSQQDNAARQP